MGLVDSGRGMGGVIYGGGRGEDGGAKTSCHYWQSVTGRIARERI